MSTANCESDLLKLFQKEVEKMERFIREDPHSKYAIDGDRDKGEGTLCRRTSTGLHCVRLNIDAKKLFSEMQRLGFFCALPMDPTRTEIECTYIGK